ncbi:hypothetical protein T05_10313 [Trichinella murrelli]|uniref:Uncharacterized protein n=1 Tax=Trichinella murrelli TaxID=144512 RepID=A0A0V0T6D6_9BILA|nr:hypothetical protein T05_10313 [Trichinella murrelli]
MPHAGRQRGPDPSEQDLSAVPHWQIPIALPDSILQREAILPNPHGILIERGTIAHESHAELLALPDEEVRKRTSDYNDGIPVNISVVSVDRVKRHPAHSGLI